MENHRQSTESFGSATMLNDTSEGELAVQERRGLQEGANQSFENGHNERRNTSRGLMQNSTYAKSKTIAEGVLDLSLLFANVSQLKNVIDFGPSHSFYILLLVLFSVILLIQIVLALLLVALGSGEDNEIDPKSVKINKAVIMLTLIIAILNVFAAVFSMAAS